MIAICSIRELSIIKVRPIKPTETPPARKINTFFSLVAVRHNRAQESAIVKAIVILGVVMISADAPIIRPEIRDDISGRLDSIVYKFLNNTRNSYNFIVT